MLDASEYIQEGLKLVSELREQGKLGDALQACQELIKVDPGNGKVRKEFERVQKQIVEMNDKKVDADLDATMPLWKEGKFDELFKIYTKLAQYAPEHARLRKLMEKLTEAVNKQQRHARNDYFENAYMNMEKFMADGKFADVMQACHELLKADPAQEKAKKILGKTQERLVEQKLTDNARLIDSPDFERSLEFLNSLLAIDPENRRVKSLRENVVKQIEKKRALDGKIIMNESIVRMKELFKAAEYEKVIQSCEEIDRLDPGNFTAKLFRKKAEKTMHAEIDDLGTKKLKELAAALEPEYIKNPAGYVKI